MEITSFCFIFLFFFFPVLPIFISFYEFLRSCLFSLQFLISAFVPVIPVLNRFFYHFLPNFTRYVCLSVGLDVCVFVLSVRMNICLFFCEFVCLSVGLSACLFVSLCICLCECVCL